MSFFYFSYFFNIHFFVFKFYFQYKSIRSHNFECTELDSDDRNKRREEGEEKQEKNDKDDDKDEDNKKDKNRVNITKYENENANENNKVILSKNESNNDKDNVFNDVQLQNTYTSDNRTIENFHQKKKKIDNNFSVANLIDNFEKIENGNLEKRKLLHDGLNEKNNFFLPTTGILIEKTQSKKASSKKGNSCY